MDRVILRPLAKINLGLDVVGKRDDGYHEVSMIMQSLKLHDHMTMDVIPENEIRMKCNLPFLPTDDRNLVVKAIKLIKEEYGISRGVSVNLKKVIPVSGGMAGGSTDAASAIYGMNLLFHLGLKQQDMMDIGLKLGADVPFCIMRGTVLAEGIGELLTPIKQAPNTTVLIVKPKFGVSTAGVYQEYDSLTEVNHPDIPALKAAIEAGEIKEMTKYMGNSLEAVTEKNYPIITEIKDKMTEMGSIKSMMSGSGPTVFGLFENREDAEEAAKYFQDTKGIKQVYVTSFYHVKGR